MPRNTDFIATSVWIRPPRTRRGQPSLSREQIVGGAIELLDAEGLPGLSMRRLGTKLGAGATSLYWYVRNKDELLELAVDAIMGEVEIPDPAVVGWRAAAGDLARGMRSMILRHPWMTSLFGVHPTLGPEAMRVGERAVGVLTAAGFSGLEVAHASSLLMSHAIGSATTDAAMHTATSRSGKSAKELAEELEPHLENIAADYPDYAKWWSENRTTDLEKLQEDNFTFGLERLLDGLEVWLDRSS
jgi:AcrR family transcriptional regulator